MYPHLHQHATKTQSRAQELPPMVRGVLENIPYLSTRVPSCERAPPACLSLQLSQATPTLRTSQLESTHTPPQPYAQPKNPYPTTAQPGLLISVTNKIEQPHPSAPIHRETPSRTQPRQPNPKHSTLAQESLSIYLKHSIKPRFSVPLTPLTYGAQLTNINRSRAPLWAYRKWSCYTAPTLKLT